MGPIAGDKAGEGGALLLLGRPARFVVACGRRRGHKAFSAADNEQPLDVSLRARKSKMTAALPLGTSPASAMQARTPMTLQAWASCTAQVRFGTEKPI